MPWESNLRKFEVRGPQTVANKNTFLDPGLTIEIESMGPTAKLVYDSFCVVRAVRLADNQGVLNGDRVDTGVVVENTGTNTTSVTKKFEFNSLAIPECGEFRYDITIVGYPPGGEPIALVAWGEKYTEAIRIN
jgi:hypothetical protein